MATGTKIGKDTAVKLGSYTILGLGTWNMTGVTIDQYEDTSFGDEWKTFVPGLKDGGQITFAGVYKPADSTGQQALRTAADAGTNLTDIRFYVDNTSYWIPKTTNPASYINVTEWSISADKSGVMQTSFTCKVSGEMELL
jgi:hypothetical protein